MRTVGMVAAVVAALAHPFVAAAQQRGPAEWMLDWSPLRSFAALEHGVRNNHQNVPALLLPEHQIGSFWFAANPAALASEGGAAHGEFGAYTGASHGDYRRPLEPGGVSDRSVQAIGWRRISERAGLAGHARYNEVRYSPGTLSSSLSPYATVPFIVVDTTRSDHNLSAIDLAGAGARSFGRFAVGASLGYEAADGHSELTRVPRLNRAARSGGVVGINFRVGASASVGAVLRHARDAETIRVTNAGAPTLVTVTHGYAAPSRVALAHNQLFYRRREAELSGGGVTAGGSIRTWTWSGAAEFGRAAERQWSQRTQEPATDSWGAGILDARLALRAPLTESTVAIMEAGLSRIAGDARVAGVDTIVYRNNDVAFRTGMQIRWQPAHSPWSALGTARMQFDQRDRGDLPEISLRTVLEELHVQSGAELSRQIAGMAVLAAGYSLTSYQGRGSMPAPANFHPDIRELIGGENAYYATPALGHAITAGALVNVRSSSQLRLSSSYSTLSQRDGTIGYQLAPGRSRSRWSVNAAFVMAPGSLP